MESNAEEAGPTSRSGLIRGRGMITFPVERNAEEAGPTLRSGLIRGKGRQCWKHCSRVSRQTPATALGLATRQAGDLAQENPWSWWMTHPSR